MNTPIDLTHPIHEDMPVYPGTDKPVISTPCTIEQDGFLEKKITFWSHTGTHMDAPAHLVEGGKHLDQYDIDRFCGSAMVVHLDSNESGSIDTADLKHLEDQLRSIDFLLIHTGWSRHWGSDDYFSNFPTLTPEAAEWVAGLGLKGIGIDAISVDRADTVTYPVHNILLGSDMVIIENLVNLDQLPETPIDFTCFPLFLQQADGSPIRAVAFV